MIKENNNWDKIIDGNPSTLQNQIKRTWEYKDLIFLMIKKDFITYYKQTILGPLWYLIQPILATIMYMIIFGSLAKIGTDNIPQTLFYFSGTMLWIYFSGVLKDVSNVFYNNKAIFGKVYFPRLVMPISIMVSQLIKLGIQFALFVIVYCYYLLNGMRINTFVTLLIFPIAIIWLSFLAAAVGMVITSITTKYRDLALVLDYLISLWMYATPVVYPMSEVPSNMQIFFCLNPVCVPIELFRYAFFGTFSVPLWGIIYSVMVTTVLFIVGGCVFFKTEKTFVDVI